MNIYFLDTRRLSAESLKTGYSMLDNAKKNRVDSCKNGKREMIIASDMLARKLVSDYTNTSPAEIVFANTSLGKPVLPKGDANFNISHSGFYCIGCIDANPCGIDIEVLRDVNLKSAIRFCTKNELEYIQNAVDKAKAFLTIWTKKEAYFKSIGCGIATVLSSFDTLEEVNINTTYGEDYVLSVYCKDVKFISPEKMEISQISF